MATPCQGFTFTWGGATLSKVSAFEADTFRSLPIGRTTAWTPDLGEVRVLTFAPTNLPTSDYGRRRRLTIQCPSSTVPTAAVTLTLFDRDCIYRGYRVDAQSNDAVRFAYTFTVQDTVDAPTNP